MTVHSEPPDAAVLQVATPFWRDRPDLEAIDIATAVGLRAPRLRLTIGPLAVGVRTIARGRPRPSGCGRQRVPQPHTTITIAAFGPRTSDVAADVADHVVLNLVPPEQVARVRAALDAQADRSGRPRPPIVTWVAVALDPGATAVRQLTAQLTAYLRPPGYGEPIERVCALGSQAQITARRVLAALSPSRRSEARGESRWPS